jgi:hypothetical protein
METTETETLKPAVRHAGHTLTEEGARAKMQAYIDASKGRAVGTLEKIRDVVPTDRVVPAREMDFRFGGDGTRLEYLAPGWGTEGGLHRNALTQLAGRLNIPLAYVDHLQTQGAEWSRDLLARTLREHTKHNTDDRYLIRSVQGEARAVLSDKFRRRDCRPGALALLEAAQQRGVIVSDGAFTDTRSVMRFIKPEVIEVFPGEWMVFGASWGNSDYGRGASDLRLFFWRCWCWNGAEGESVVRQIHIGRRLQDDVDYAADTIAADATASALALRDAFAGAFSDGKITRMIEGIRSANETKIDGKARAEGLKKVLTKGEVAQVVDAFNGADVENMPAGNTLWRWSNAISWVGGQLDDADRAIDFARLAGDVMKPAMPKEEARA